MFHLLQSFNSKYIPEQMSLGSRTLLRVFPSSPLSMYFSCFLLHSISSLLYHTLQCHLLFFYLQSSSITYIQTQCWAQGKYGRIHVEFFLSMEKNIKEKRKELRPRKKHKDRGKDDETLEGKRRRRKREGIGRGSCTIRVSYDRRTKRDTR